MLTKIFLHLVLVHVTGKELNSEMEVGSSFVKASFSSENGLVVNHEEYVLVNKQPEGPSEKDEKFHLKVTRSHFAI